MRVIEYSDDMQSWVTVKSFDQGAKHSYMRITEEFDRAWNKNQVFDKLEDAVNKKARVEYSQDGGFSWVPLRHSGAITEDTARVITMLSRHYGVRTIQMSDINQGKVMGSGMIQNLNNMTMGRAVNKFARPPATKSIYIYSNSEGNIDFGPTKPVGVALSRIDQTIFFDMSQPNTNSFSITGPGDPNNPTKIEQGFVFKIRPANEVQEISHWFPVLGIDANDYIYCQSARVYDWEMDSIFAGVGDILSLRSGKYRVGWGNRVKLGDQWIFPKAGLSGVINNITTQGAISNNSIEPTKIESKPNGFTSEVSKEYIMGVREQLEKLLESNADEEILTENLMLVMKYRNDCIEELKKLNIVIDTVKERLLGGQQNS